MRTFITGIVLVWSLAGVFVPAHAGSRSSAELAPHFKKKPRTTPKKRGARGKTPKTTRLEVTLERADVLAEPRSDSPVIGYVVKGEVMTKLGVSKDYNYFRVRFGPKDEGWIDIVSAKESAKPLKMEEALPPMGSRVSASSRPADTTSAPRATTTSSGSSGFSKGTDTASGKKTASTASTASTTSTAITDAADAGADPAAARRSAKAERKAAKERKRAERKASKESRASADDVAPTAEEDDGVEDDDEETDDESSGIASASTETVSTTAAPTPGGETRVSLSARVGYALFRQKFASPFASAPFYAVQFNQGVVDIAGSLEVVKGFGIDAHFGFGYSAPTEFTWIDGSTVRAGTASYRFDFGAHYRLELWDAIGLSLTPRIGFMLARFEMVDAFPGRALVTSTYYAPAAGFRLEATRIVGGLGLHVGAHGFFPAFVQQGPYESGDGSAAWGIRAEAAISYRVAGKIRLTAGWSMTRFHSDFWGTSSRFDDGSSRPDGPDNDDTLHTFELGATFGF